MAEEYYNRPPMFTDTPFSEKMPTPPPFDNPCCWLFPCCCMSMGCMIYMQLPNVRGIPTGSKQLSDSEVKQVLAPMQGNWKIFCGSGTAVGFLGSSKNGTTILDVKTFTKIFATGPLDLLKWNDAHFISQYPAPSAFSNWPNWPTSRTNAALHFTQSIAASNRERNT